MNPWIRLSRNGAVASMLTLLLLCVAWETFLAPLRPGSLMWIKAIPLLFPLPGLIRGHRYTYQWCSMFVLIWFIEGVMRGWGDHGLSQRLAQLEILLSVLAFAATVVYARLTRRPAA